jgi:hypothetical protein
LVGTWDNTSIVSILYHSQYQVCTYLIPGKNNPWSHYQDQADMKVWKMIQYQYQICMKIFNISTWLIHCEKGHIVQDWSWLMSLGDQRFFLGQKIRKRQLHLHYQMRVTIQPKSPNPIVAKWQHCHHHSTLNLCIATLSPLSSRQFARDVSFTGNLFTIVTSTLLLHFTINCQQHAIYVILKFANSKR